MTMRRFTILAAALAVGLALAVSPFASSSPDGLEHVAGDRAFLDQGRLAPVQESRAHRPATRCRASTIQRLATGLAGFAGTLAVLGLGALVPVRTRRCRHERAATPRRRRRRRPVEPRPPARPAREAPRAHRRHVVAVSVPAPAWPVLAAPRACWRPSRSPPACPRGTRAARGAVVLPLLGLLALTLPFRPDDGAVAAGRGQGADGTASAVLLGATTSFPDVLHALERLRAPAVATTSPR